jgi:hypothetical protein
LSKELFNKIKQKYPNNDSEIQELENEVDKLADKLGKKLLKEIEIK